MKEGEDGPLRLHSQEEALTEAVGRIRDRMDPERLNVLVAHCFAAGAEPSQSERTLVGTAAQVGTDLFSCFDYVALGHLHRPQALSPRMRYSGTPLAYSFGEAGQAKSFAAVTIEKGIDPVVALLPIIPLRPMVKVRGTLQELLEDPQYEGLGDAYVCAELTESAGLGQPFARLKRRFLRILEMTTPETLPVAGAPVNATFGSARPDLEEDFLAFEQRLRRGAPPEPLVEAFRELRASLERAR